MAEFLRATPARRTALAGTIGRIENPRAKVVETWPAGIQEDAFLAGWRGSLVRWRPESAGGPNQWAVIQNGAVGDTAVKVRVDGGAAADCTRDTLQGRSMEVARGIFLVGDGTTETAGANAFSIRLRATGEAVQLAQQAAPSQQIIIIAVQSRAQMLCSPSELQQRVDVSFAPWMSASKVTELTEAMNAAEARTIATKIVEEIGGVATQRVVVTLQQMGVQCNLRGAHLPAAATEMIRFLSGMVGEATKASRVVDGLVDGARPADRQIGDDAFRGDSFAFTVEGLRLLLSAANDGLVSSAAEVVSMAGTFASGAAAFAGTTLGDMIGRAVAAPAPAPASASSGPAGPMPSGGGGGGGGGSTAASPGGGADSGMSMFTPSALAGQPTADVLAALDAAAGAAGSVGGTLADARLPKIPRTTLGPVAAAHAALGAIRAITAELDHPLYTLPEGWSSGWTSARVSWSTAPPADEGDALVRIQQMVEMVAVQRAEKEAAAGSSSVAGAAFTGRVKDLPQDKWTAAASHDPLAVDAAVADMAATDQAIIAEHLAAQRRAAPAPTAPLELRRLYSSGSEGAGFGKSAGAMICSTGKTNGTLAPFPRSISRCHTNLHAHLVGLGSRAVTPKDMAEELTVRVKARATEAQTGNVRKLEPWITLYGGKPSRPGKERWALMMPGHGDLQAGDVKSPEDTIKALGALGHALWDVWGVGIGLRHVRLPAEASAAGMATMSFQLPAVYMAMRDAHVEHGTIIEQLELELAGFAIDVIAWRTLANAPAPDLAARLEALMQPERVESTIQAHVFHKAQQAESARHARALAEVEARLAARIDGSTAAKKSGVKPPDNPADRPAKGGGRTTDAGKGKAGGKGGEQGPALKPAIKAAVTLTADEPEPLARAAQRGASPTPGGGAAAAATASAAAAAAKKAAAAEAAAKAAAAETAATGSPHDGLSAEDRKRNDISRKLAENPEYRITRRADAYTAIEALYASNVGGDRSSWPCARRALRETHRDCAAEAKCSKCRAKPFDASVEGPLIAKVKKHCSEEIAKSMPDG